MTTETPDLPALPNNELLLHSYAEDAYLDYAMATVKDRALAQVQDGQKPVHRRILYAMRQLGLTPDSKAVKSARIVGDVLGKFHPHGDTAAYDAMVRMAQSFALRYPLITGQGNFGSRDGDRAAAMRYTEAKLAPIANLLLDELGQGTIDYRDNYDGSQKEPVLLPARLPFALLNGTMGIAVGMASNMPPHNLREIASAAVAMLGNPDIATAEIMALLPGPDFPDGGQLISPAADIAGAYETGRGSLRIRARWVREDLARGQWQIVIRELPYQVSTRQVLEQLEVLTNPQPAAGKKQLTQQQTNLKQLALEFLERATDESGKDDPVRLVLVPRTSKIDEAAMMAFLLANTSLEETFGINATMIGLDGGPATKGLIEVLREWCSFRTGTVRRRSQWELDQAEKRIHILDGRMTVYLNLDKVIKVIRTADDPRAELITAFTLSEIQADDILDMRLRALNKLEGIRIEKELADLRKEAARLMALLKSDAALRKLVIKEIEADSAKYGDDRRTLIKEEARAAGAASTARIVTDEPLTVIVSKNLWVRARGGHDIDSATLNYRGGDAEGFVLKTRSLWPVVFLDSMGRTYSVQASEAPTGRGDGAPLSTLIDIQPGARIVQAMSADPEQAYLFAGQNGYGFIAQLKNCVASKRAGKAFITLDETESPITPLPLAADLSGFSGHLAVGSSDGRMLVFPVAEVKALAAGGKGVMLMVLEKAQQMTALLHLQELRIESTLEVKGRLLPFTLKGEEFAKHVGHRARKGAQLPKKGVIRS